MNTVLPLVLLLAPAAILLGAYLALRSRQS